jgi:UDP-3-O-[3-hydroxymyristoyl] glucosamine N-acyltransferase
MQIKIKDIIRLTGGKASGCEDLLITGFGSLEEATASELSFFIEQKPTEKFLQSSAGAILVSKDLEIQKSSQNLIFVDNPKLAFVQIQNQFLPTKKHSQKTHTNSWVDPSAQIGKNVTIYPFVFVDKDAQIGDNSVIYANSYIGEKTKLGKKCVIYPNCAILERVLIGDAVIIHAGNVIGSDGFGYATENKIHHKIPHRGGVEIADNVEIGANCTIDRGTITNTKIGEGTKIDNLVHIAHNVEIGKNCLLAGQVGIAGSTKLGDNVYCGGQVGILGHNKILDDCIFHPRSCFLQENKTLPAGSHMAGVPAIPIAEWRRNIVVQKKLVLLEKKIRALENKVTSKTS